MTESLSMDQPLINKLYNIILANMHDENFGVEKLAKEAGKSRISVSRKIKSIKNQSVSQFIREIHLERAMEMLRRNEGAKAE
jgi:AraC-like DNA-binding protein